MAKGKKKRMELIGDIIENDYPELVTIAEIGVWKCNTLAYLLENYSSKIKEYWAIDPFIPIHPVPYACEPFWLNLTTVKWNKNYFNMAKRQLAHSQLKHARLRASEAVGMFPNEYFDIVFLDGDHTYEALIEDITLWKPKVKTGGYLTGHDYSAKYPGVKQAVDELLGIDNISRESDKTWIYIIP